MLGKVRRLRVLPPVMLAVLIGVASCSSGSGNSAGSQPAGTSSGVPGASSGGATSASRDLTIAIAAEPVDSEPCNSENGAALLMNYNVIQALTNLQVDTRKPGPLLATEWKQNSPTVWEFALRKDVTYQDGTPFNAESAVYGINRALNNPKIACSDTAKLGAGIKVTPKATGDYTLQVTTSSPDPILPVELSYVGLISPKSPVETAPDKPIGTGPYTWDNWQRGQSITFSRWDKYWGPAPEVAKATIIFRKEASVRASVVQAGEADIAFSILADNATTDGTTKSFALDSTYDFRLPIQSAPFTDVRVRQAVQYAIDREGIATAVLGQTGQPATQLVADSNNGYLSDYTGPSYDPEKAKSLLAAAKAEGVDTSVQIDLVGMTNQFANSDEATQAVAQNLQDAGFNVKLQIVDADAWKKLLFKPFPPDQTPTILAIKHDNTSGDASASFSSYMISTGCCSSSMSKTVDDYITQAFAAAIADRGALFQKAALEEYMNDVSIVPVASIQGLAIISPKIDYTPNAFTLRYQLLLQDVKFN
jgi:peptide/nickel transport system substrate-binding protein